MKRRPPPPVRRGQRYTVLVTAEFDRAIKAQYKYFACDPRLRDDYADEWLERVRVFIAQLETPHSLGAMDPERYASNFANQRIPGTHTLVFYLVDDDQIFLATAGFEGRDWPSLMRAIGPLVERQVLRLRRK